MGWISWRSKPEIVGDKVTIKVEAELADVIKDIERNYQGDWFTREARDAVAREIKNTISSIVARKLSKLIEEQVKKHISDIKSLVNKDLEQDVLKELAKECASNLRHQVLEKIKIESMVTAVYAKTSLLLAKEIVNIEKG